MLSVGDSRRRAGVGRQELFAPARDKENKGEEGEERSENKRP